MTRLLLALLVLLQLPAAPAGAEYVDPARLPPPRPQESVANPPRVVPRGERTPTVPPGYRVELVAEGLRHARMLLALPDGGILVSEARAGRVTLLKDGRAATFAEGFDRPSGMALVDGAVLVADLERVWRLPWPAPGPRRPLTPEGALGDAGGHSTRMLAVRGDELFVAIGSRGNIAEEAAPRATIRRFRLDGSGGTTFAAGLRNPVGLAVRPGSDELWTVVNERDGLGDGLVPDYLTRVAEGAFYGWPYSYIGSHPQPGFAAKAPDKVKAAVVPDLLFEAHSAPLGLAFWRGDAYVALHGSWNRGEPTGTMVVRVPFADGRPKHGYEPFVTGFVIKAGRRAEVWGRPVGLAVGADDALYVADDAGQTVWRIVKE